MKFINWNTLENRELKKIKRLLKFNYKLDASLKIILTDDTILRSKIGAECVRILLFSVDKDGTPIGGKPTSIEVFTPAILRKIIDNLNDKEKFRERLYKTLEKWSTSIDGYTIKKEYYYNLFSKLAVILDDEPLKLLLEVIAPGDYAYVEKD